MEAIAKRAIDPESCGGQDWIERELTASKLPDARLEKRLRQLVEQMAKGRTGDRSRGHRAKSTPGTVPHRRSGCSEDGIDHQAQSMDAQRPCTTCRTPGSKKPAPSPSACVSHATDDPPEPAAPKKHH